MSIDVASLNAIAEALPSVGLHIGLGMLCGCFVLGVLIALGLCLAALIRRSH